MTLTPEPWLWRIEVGFRVAIRNETLPPGMSEMVQKPIWIRRMLSRSRGDLGANSRRFRPAMCI